MRIPFDISGLMPFVSTGPILQASSGVDWEKNSAGSRCLSCTMSSAVLETSLDHPGDLCLPPL
jgi:hypothetical protein